MEKSFSSDFKFKAITWAAARSGMSYGEYVRRHTPDEVYDVYSEYEKYKAKHKKKENPQKDK